MTLHRIPKCRSRGGAKSSCGPCEPEIIFRLSAMEFRTTLVVQRAFRAGDQEQLSGLGQRNRLKGVSHVAGCIVWET